MAGRSWDNRRSPLDSFPLPRASALVWQSAPCGHAFEVSLSAIEKTEQLCKLLTYMYGNTYPHFVNEEL